MRVISRLDWSHSLFYLTLLLWTRRVSGLADFSSKMMMMMMVMVVMMQRGGGWMGDTSAWLKISFVTVMRSVITAVFQMTCGVCVCVCDVRKTVISVC